MSRLLIPQLSFADLQLQSQGVHLDATLQGIADFLEKHAALVELVRKDLEQGLKKPNAGRNGISPGQTLRSLTLMRVKNWDYRELAERINDGYTLRSFTLFDANAVPKHDAFNRAFNQLTPATLAALNQAVVQEAVKLGVEDGQIAVDPETGCTAAEMEADRMPVLRIGDVEHTPSDPASHVTFPPEMSVGQTITARWGHGARRRKGVA